MIRAGLREVTIVHAFGKMCSFVAQGARLIWQALRSCFGNGSWVNNAPWNNTDGWRNM
jgi:hypothetical protein